MQNEDKRVTWEGKPYTFNDEGFSWDFKDSEIIDWLADRESGKINWGKVRSLRSTRDSFIANEQWVGDPHVTTARKRGLMDLDEEHYDYGDDKDGYPSINTNSYMGKLVGDKAPKIEDKFMKSY